MMVAPTKVQALFANWVSLDSLGFNVSAHRRP